MFFLKTRDGEDYYAMLPDWRADEALDSMRIRVFVTLRDLEPAEFDNYRVMLDQAKGRMVFCSGPQTGEIS
jgi:hypothetical protein